MKIGPERALFDRYSDTPDQACDFVQLVGVSTDKPVIDKTSITGDFDYDILISLPEAPGSGRPESGGNQSGHRLCRDRSAWVEVGINEGRSRDVGGGPGRETFRKLRAVQSSANLLQRF